MEEGISDVGGSCFVDSKSVVAVMLCPISLFVTCIRFSSTVQCRVSSSFDVQVCSVL